MTVYSFTPATLSDLPRLAVWQARGHVAQWWDAAPPFTAQELALHQIRPWIVSIESRAFAYIQDYDAQEFPNHHFNHLPTGSRCIDQFIGDALMLGQGHGTALIAQHMHSLFSAGAPMIGTDPHPENTRAIHIYQKLGFRISGPARNTPEGLIMPMQASNPNDVALHTTDC